MGSFDNTTGPSQEVVMDPVGSVEVLRAPSPCVGIVRQSYITFRDKEREGGTKPTSTAHNW